MKQFIRNCQNNIILRKIPLFPTIHRCYPYRCWGSVVTQTSANTTRPHKHDRVWLAPCKIVLSSVRYCTLDKSLLTWYHKHTVMYNWSSYTSNFSKENFLNVIQKDMYMYFIHKPPALLLLCNTSQKPVIRLHFFCILIETKTFQGWLCLFRPKCG